MKKLLTALLLFILPSVTLAKITMSKEVLEGLNKLYCSAYFDDKAEKLLDRKFKEEYAKAKAVFEADVERRNCKAYLAFPNTKTKRD